MGVADRDYANFGEKAVRSCLSGCAPQDLRELLALGGCAVAPRRLLAPGVLRGAAVAEVLEDPLVGPLVGYEDRIPVRQDLGLAFELVGPHPAALTAPHECPSKRDRLFGAQVRVDVLVHYFDDGGQLGDRVPPKYLFAQRADQPLLAPYAIEVSAGGAPVAGVGQCLKPVELLPSGRYVHAAAVYPDPYRVPYLQRDTSQGVDHVLEAPEIYDSVAVYVNAGQVLHHRRCPPGAAVEVGGVDAVLHPWLYFN